MFNNILQHPIGKRIIKGSFWSLFGTAIGKFFILISSIFCARILGEYEYGELGIIRSTIAMFIVVGTAGISVTASKYISQYRANNEISEFLSIKVITQRFAIIFGLIISCLIFFFADSLARNTLEAPELATDLKWGAILLFFSIYNAYQNGILSGFENFKAIGLNTLYAGIFEFGFIVIGANLGGVTGAIIGYGISFIIFSYINSYSIRNTFKQYNLPNTPIKIQKKHYVILWRFALPAALNSIIVTASFWCLKTLLIRNSGFGELGIYEAADQWKVIMLYIPTSLSNILLPILSNVLSTGKSTVKIVKYNIILNVGLSTVFAIGVSLCSGFIMGFYGPNFENPYPLIILSISTIFTTMALVSTTAMTSKAKVWTNFIFQLIWSISMIGSAIYFLSEGLGAVGLALSILVSYMLLSITQTIYFFSYYKN